MLEYLVFRLLSLVAPHLPPKTAFWVCDRAGDIAFRLLSRRRRIVENNLVAAGGRRDASLERLARGVFREGVRYYYDTFRVGALTDAELEELVSLEGWDRLKEARERGKGTILFTAHLGSPALVAQVLAIRGYRVTTVAEPVRPQKLFDLMSRARAGRGIRVIPLGPSSIRDLMEVLRRNEIAGIVADRDVAGTGVPVQFFGASVLMPAGPAMLALRTGAALLPGFSYRRRDGHFSAFVEEPLQLDRTGDLRKDIRLNTQKMAVAIERAIRQQPEQWIVFEPIWSEQGPASRPGVDG